MLNRLTGALDFQTEALVLRAERQRVIASNIANADTPGYVARDFNFAQALRQATSGMPGVAGPSAAGGAGSVGNALGAPIAGDLMGVGGRLPPDLRYATPAQTNLDNNSVDMDRERAAFADNALKYESTLRFINGTVRTLGDAMKSHNQG
ncbi:flagellar basal body rod protein FlgB [Rubrivivax sp. RP6-9]|uniref:flagellar basal body rod protein FlgB n=1 Tax=Rubrivivax sp. RP6-9 TaxID=3415750 RepID=UPI003CC6B942